MKDETDHVRWTDLLNEYKYYPLELLQLVDSSERVASAIRTSIESATGPCSEWPPEIRQWRVVLIALIAVEMGTIADPYSRTRAHEQLLSRAREWSVTPTAVRMASAEIYPVYERLKDNLLPLSLSHKPGPVR
jgi:hypothetical protein